MHKGKHLLIDCSGVPRELCLDDQRLLEARARSAQKCGVTNPEDVWAMLKDELLTEDAQVLLVERFMPTSARNLQEH